MSSSSRAISLIYLKWNLARLFDLKSFCFTSLARRLEIWIWSCRPILSEMKQLICTNKEKVKYLKNHCPVTVAGSTNRVYTDAGWSAEGSGGNSRSGWLIPEFHRPTVVAVAWTKTTTHCKTTAGTYGYNTSIASFSEPSGWAESFSSFNITEAWALFPLIP